MRWFDRGFDFRAVVLTVVRWSTRVLTLVGEELRFQISLVRLVGEPSRLNDIEDSLNWGIYKEVVPLQASRIGKTKITEHFS